MTESAADRLAPAQAADLIRVLDRQAEWENTRGEPAKGGPVPSPADLRALQNAFEAYRSALAGYAARYNSDVVPDIMGGIVERVAAWCRMIRVVIRRAEGHAGVACPAHLVAKVYRLADRVAERSRREPVVRDSAPETLWAAIQGLDAVIRWCDGLVAPQPA